MMLAVYRDTPCVSEALGCLGGDPFISSSHPETAWPMQIRDIAPSHQSWHLNPGPDESSPFSPPVLTCFGEDGLIDSTADITLPPPARGKNYKKAW